jgi:hypothetical protein
MIVHGFLTLFFAIMDKLTVCNLVRSIILSQQIEEIPLPKHTCVWPPPFSLGAAVLATSAASTFSPAVKAIACSPILTFSVGLFALVVLGTTARCWGRVRVTTTNK